MLRPAWVLLSDQTMKPAKAGGAIVIGQTRWPQRSEAVSLPCA